MELTLVSTKKVDDILIEVFTISNYKIRTITYKSGIEFVTVLAGKEKVAYLPQIYCETNDDNGDILGFNIQTTSYGSLPTEELKKLVARMEEAICVVEVLTAKFVKQ